MCHREVLPGLNWVYGWEINDFWSTAGSTQFNRTIDDGTNEAYLEWAQSWTIGYSLTDRLGAFTEWFGLFPHRADTARPEHYCNGGFTFLVSNNVQWDIRAGVGLAAADDYFVGTGLSLRFRWSAIAPSFNCIARHRRLVVTHRCLDHVRAVQRVLHRALGDRRRG